MPAISAGRPGDGSVGRPAGATHRRPVGARSPRPTAATGAPPAWTPPRSPGSGRSSSVTTAVATTTMRCACPTVGCCGPCRTRSSPASWCTTPGSSSPAGASRLLNDGTRPWLMADETDPDHHWFWILSGSPAADGRTIQLFVAEMAELGDHYLAHAEPQATWLVTVDATTLQPVDAELAPDSSTDLYGFSVVSDPGYTYLYSHCHRQFGWSAMGPIRAPSTCAWPGCRCATSRRCRSTGPAPGWTDDPLAAVPVVSAAAHRQPGEPRTGDVRRLAVPDDRQERRLVGPHDRAVQRHAPRPARGSWKHSCPNR